MLAEDKVTDIYCRTDNFCKEFASQLEKFIVGHEKNKYINKHNRINDAKIMSTHILLYTVCFRYFKHYYLQYYVST